MIDDDDTAVYVTVQCSIPGKFSPWGDPYKWHHVVNIKSAHALAERIREAILDVVVEIVQ